uniref:NAD(P)-binding protein n=1 Tax=Mycena chlorophos TaxID=658473 RepID=A0ABQ0LZD5_MYCCL|nr:NAD(P)-binding protein [Mycena chlorophos]
MSLPTFSFETTADEVASALKDQIVGKNVLITGTSIKGLGFEAARAIAPYASLVVITGYNAERLRLSQEALRKEFPSANIRPLTLDVSSLGSVRKAAAEVNAYPEPLHVLIHNASIMGAYSITEDDLEIQAATAHFGPFLLSKLLAPKMIASSTKTFIPRVVYISSVSHAWGITGIDWKTLRHGDPPAVANTTEGFAKRYSEVKAADILTAAEISRRAKGQLRAYSVHPGTIWTNGFEKEHLQTAFKQFGLINPDRTPNTEVIQWKSIQQGAATHIVAAFDPRIDDQVGAYLVDGKVANEQVAAHAADPANAEKLWDLTEEILGEKWEF